jgi:hypothetical protein
MFRNKSVDEMPWDSFVHAMEPTLKRLSRPLRQRYGRWLALGSPVRVSTDRGEAVRFPIEVRGGDREYAVATVYVYGLARFYNEPRLEEIARAAVTAALEHPTAPPPRPGDLVLTYP